MEDLSAFNQADVVAAAAAAANVAASKVKVADVKFVVELTYTFPSGNDVSGNNLPKLKGAIASANGVFEYQVTVSPQRRLSASMRQLSAATFDVTITSESPEEAMSVKSSSQDNAALSSSLTSAGITTTQPTNTAPVTKVEVETDVVVGSDVDDAAMDAIVAGLNSDLDTQLVANIQGATGASSQNAQKETSSPTAAPGSGVGGGGDGSGGGGVGTAGSGTPPSAVMAASALLAVLSVCA